MAGYPSLTHIVQQGNNAQHLLQQQYVIPGLQSFDPKNTKQQVYQKQTLPVVENTVTPIIRTPQQGHIINVNEAVNVNFSNPVTLSGQKFHVNETPFLIPNQNSNASNFLLCTTMGVTTNAKPAPVQVMAHTFQTNQQTEAQHLNVSNNGVRSVTGSSIVSQQNLQKEKQTEAHIKGVVKVPEPIQVNINKEIRERVGSLKINLSDNITVNISDKSRSIDLIGITRNGSKSAILDLSFMRHLFDITNVDIIFPNDISYEARVCDALRQIVNNKILSDWIILKCEKKQIPVFKIINQIEIYSINNFSTLLNVIAQESCLPLPFITKDAKDHMKYFYINFPKKSNDKVKKLNVAVFHDADNGRKKLPCKYPGIRLDCNFEPAIQCFTFHVHQSAVPAYETYVSHIRQLLIYNHIVWGFLQAWIRKVREQYNGCFKMEEIAKNLSLCQSQQSAEHRKHAENDNEMIYFIDYLNLYLKFDPVTLKETKSSFSIDNFETNFVCDIPVVQYYRQFFLINDMHYSDALKNIILFSKKNEESGTKHVTEFVYMPQEEEPTTRSNDGFLPPGGISRSAGPTQVPVAEAVEKQRPPIVSGNNSTNAPRHYATIQTDARFEAAKSVDVEMGGNNADVIHMGPTESVQNAAPAAVTSAPKPSAPLTRPLLKTRTVQEINSSVDLNKILDGGEINFDSCFKVVDISAYKKSEEGPSSVPILIRESLNHCYVKNMVEISSDDEASDPSVVQRIFDEAVAKAMEMETLDSFVESLYLSLQLHFTNATCQKLMNKFVCKAIEKRFPALTARLGVHTNPAANESYKATPTPTKQPLVSQISPVANLRKHATMPSPFPTEAELRKLYPHLYNYCPAPNMQIRGVLIRPVSANPVAVDPNVFAPTAFPNVRRVNPVVQRVAPQRMQQTLNKSVPSQKEKSILKRPDPVLTNQAVTTNPHPPRLQLAPTVRFKHPVPLQVDPQKTLIAVRGTPVTLEKRDSNELREPRATPKTQPPQVSAVSIIPAVVQPIPRVRATYPVPKSVAQPSILLITQNDRVRQPQTQPAPPCVNSSTSKQQLPVRPSAVGSATSTMDVTAVNAPPDIDPEILDPGYSFGRLSQVSPVLHETPVFRGVAEKSEPIPVFKIPRDKVQARGSRVSAGDGSEEISTPISKEEDLIKKFKLKPCSVVLTRDEGIERKYNNKCQKKRRKRTDSSDDSADDDFVPKVRHTKKSKKISELQYMEAKTRVLQRLRKRNAMYLGGECERVVYTSNELKEFLVRRNSLASVSSKDGNPREQEKADEDSAQTTVAGESDGRTGEEPADVGADDPPLVDNNSCARVRGEWKGVNRRSKTVAGSAKKTRKEESEGSAKAGAGVGDDGPPVQSESRASAASEAETVAEKTAKNGLSMLAESVRREARVVLTRLEDMPEFRNYRVKLKEENADLSDDGSGRAVSKGLNLPREKRKYFEIKEGNLYLKEQYQVKNGVIVPKDTACSRSGGSERHESETNFFPVYIKSETVVE